MKVVIKIGGHIFDSQPIYKGVIEYSELFKKLQIHGHKVVVVIGGGTEARKYMQIARKLGGSELLCDMLGIVVSRLYARLLITALGDNAYPAGIELV